MWTLRNDGPRPSRTRRIARVGQALGIAALLGGIPGLAACSGEPVAPTPARPALSAAAATTDGTVVKALLWSRPVGGASAARTIGPEGGSFSIPNGITVTVPAGAVRSNTAFSVTRLPGRIVAYEFEPHGTTFDVPLRITHPTRDLDFRRVDLRSVRGAYFRNASALDHAAGSAVASEFRPTSVSLEQGAVSFTVDHFSGYMVSWGRR